MRSEQMTRLQFMKNAVQGAVFVTMPNLLGNCSIDRTRLYGGMSSDPVKNAKARQMRKPILEVLNAGITAPNPHNSQAWQFVLLNDLEALLFVDKSRILLETDPTSRQIHIGHGALLAHTRIAASYLGYIAKIKLFPQGTYNLKQIGQKPVAHIQLVSRTDSQPDPLYEQLAKRMTNRDTYTGKMITDAEFRKIRQLTQPKYSQLLFINKPSALQEYNQIFYDAFKIEISTFAKNEESRIWFRLSEKDIYQKRDGITLESNAISGLKLWLAKKFFFSLEKKSYHSAQNTRYALDSYREKINSSKGIIFWQTQTNSMYDWVNVGQDYARLQLALTQMGLVMHPLSQVAQEYAEMIPLQNKFNKMLKVTGTAKIQMAVRVGRSDYQFFAPRRNLFDMLRRS